MAAVLASALIGERIGASVGQAEGVIQLAIDQQPAIGGDRGTAKLQHQTPVETELQRAPARSPVGSPIAPRLVPHKLLHSNP